MVSGKWDIGHFEQMLADLTTIAAGLPFGAEATVALPYDRSVAAREDVLYHMFVYLRHALSDAAPAERQLLPSLRMVLQEPHQRLERTKRRVALQDVRRLDPIGLEHMVTGRGTLTAVGPGIRQRVPLARVLGGYLPERVDEGHVEVTWDTAENRFVKAFIGMAGDIVDGMRGVVELGRMASAFAARILDDCRTMDAALRPIAQHALWRAVGPMVHVPSASPVLQRRRGYSAVYRHFAALRLASRIPLDADLLRDLLDAKDIARLYELWCFFTMVSMVEERLGAPVRASGVHYSETEVSVRWEMDVEWPDGTRLVYNPRFSRSRLLEWRSYSVPLRPDMALHIPAGPNRGWHLFDAKFRVDRLDTVMPPDAEDEEGNDASERRGTFKRGDLYKMHAYRDAIPHTRTVWILYPGTEMRFFDKDVPALCANPASLPVIVMGVGGVPLLPDATEHSYMHSIVEHLLAP